MARTANDVQHQELRVLHDAKKSAIRRRLAEFRAVPPADYFYEIAYCLLTPQTSAEHADRAIGALRALSFHSAPVDPEPILADRSSYIRFHKTKARHLLYLKEQYPEIVAELSGGRTPEELREWLVHNVRGLGYKESTHFLRNVGRNGGLAILDRHILRNLRRYGAVRSLPHTLSRKKYVSIEHRFMKFAERVGIPLDELDLLFWSMETGVIRK